MHQSVGTRACVEPRLGAVVHGGHVGRFALPAGGIEGHVVGHRRISRGERPLVAQRFRHVKRPASRTTTLMVPMTSSERRVRGSVTAGRPWVATRRPARRTWRARTSSGTSLNRHTPSRRGAATTPLRTGRPRAAGPSRHRRGPSPRAARARPGRGCHGEQLVEQLDAGVGRRHAACGPARGAGTSSRRGWYVMASVAPVHEVTNSSRACACACAAAPSWPPAMSHASARRGSCAMNTTCASGGPRPGPSSAPSGISGTSGSSGGGSPATSGYRKPISSTARP